MRISTGFIGLGNMGVPMAHNLLKAGHPLSVFNRTASRADSLCAQGATRATSPRVLAEQSDIILSIVADDTALKAIALGDDGVLAGLTPGKIHVDMSTVSPDISKELDQHYRAKGTHYIAAPVFGRPDAAAAAKLWICPAGSAEAVARCRPLFDACLILPNYSTGFGGRLLGESPLSRARHYYYQCCILCKPFVFLRQ